MNPLAPLTPDEIKQTSQLISAEFKTKEWEFISVALKEPLKSLVLQYMTNLNSNSTEQLNIPRKAFVILLERSTGNCFESLVNLTTEQIESLNQIKSGLQPIFVETDDFVCEEIVKSDPEVIRRCKELGYPDMELVAGDAWTICFFGEELEGRYLQFYMYGKKHASDNMYAHPLDFVPVVDLLKGRVIRIQDLPIHNHYEINRDENTEIPSTTFNSVKELMPPDFYRKDLKPIHIEQPLGPSFTVEGHQISWQKFNLSISFNRREGLVLHNITYKDGDRIRPLIYRASVVELLVPYGDPRYPFPQKAALDVSGSGLGFGANPLQLGCDCLGFVKYFDGVINDESGNPKVIKDAICLHEEDAGILFKHTYLQSGQVTLARSRRLVLSFFTTILNYDYGFYWYFNQDASIAFEVKLTGSLSTNLYKGNPEELSSAFGSLVAPNVTAQPHQHLFVVRLDTMIDGPKNSVSLVDVLPVEGEFGSKTNPYGQGMQIVETKLKNTTEGQTDCKAETSRVWKIWNEGVINEVTKKPVAYSLVPRNGPTLIAKEGSFVRERGEFAKHAVWVTQYNEEELFPAGHYANQAKREGGMMDWTKEEKNIQNEDIVIWHVFGLNHVARVEDFPIMPVETTGFVLKPLNFFETNPALDVPPPEKCHKNQNHDPDSLCSNLEKCKF